MAIKRYKVRARGPIPKRLKPVVERLNSKSVKERRQALKDLGRSQDPRAVPYAKPLLVDPIRKVRQAAFSALKEIVGFRQAIKFVSQIDFTAIPIRNSYTSEHSRREQRSYKQHLVNLAKAAIWERQGTSKKEWGKKLITHRGVAVYYVPWPTLAEFTFGRIFIGTSRPKEMEPFDIFWAEHELGELISHRVGLGMEIIYAQEKIPVSELIPIVKTKVNT